MDSSRSADGLRGRTASFSSITEAFPLLRVQASEANVKKENEKLWSLMSSYLASDVHTIQRSIANHVEYTLVRYHIRIPPTLSCSCKFLHVPRCIQASSRFNFDSLKAYLATAHSVRDRLIGALCVPFSARLTLYSCCILNPPRNLRELE
jgi:glycogen phosphorylase